MNRIRTRSGENDSRAASEGGFTLLEMVISIVLLTMIIGAVSAAFVTSMNATSATRQRVNVSDDAQLISGFLTRDAQATGGTDPQTGVKDPNLGVETPPFTTGWPRCSVPGTPILAMRWIDLAPGTTYESDYSYVATATGPYVPQQLLRTVCSTTSGITTASATSVLANNVVTTPAGTLSTPVAWCDGHGPTSPSCPPAVPNTAAFPDTVSLGVSVNNAAQNLTPSFSFILNASLRPQSNSSPDLGSSAGTASLLLLGGGACLFAQSASFNLTIYGASALNCATNLKKDADPFGPVFVTAPGTCNDFPASPPCTVVNTTFTDPFLARISSGALAPPAVDCSGTAPAVVGGHWRPGTYPSDPQATGIVHPFDPGIYVFCNGLTGDVTANLTGGPIGGTFFYFFRGSYNCETPTGSPPDTSPSCNSTVLISPPTSGMYDGLAVWQASTDASTIRFSKGLVNIAGTYYAPSALVNMKNGNININQLVAYGIDGTPGNPDVHVGPPLRVLVTNPPPPGDPLPDGTRGQVYSGAQATAVDGTGVYNTWSISPNIGLTISATGAIGGTISAGAPTGVQALTITVHDTDGEVATVTTHININSALTITGSLPNWTVNQPGYPANPLTPGGGSGGYTWTPVQIAPGLQMDATGTISGTPTTVGAFNPTITLHDSINDVTTITPTVNITPPPLSPTVLLIANGGGGIAGKAEANDTIAITWSQSVTLSSICSSWANDTQTVTGVSVTMAKSNGGSKNNLSLTGGKVGVTNCAGGNVKIGTFTTLSTGYNTTNGPESFTNSTVSWNSGTNKLTITLGSCGTCPTGTVALSTYTYTPTATITEAAYPAVTATGTASTGNVQNF